MAKQVFKLSGFRELERNLLELATREARRLGQHALKKAAEPILADYKAKTRVRTGHLQQSDNLGPRARLNKRQKKLTPKPGPSEIEIHIGTADPAGIQEEFGGRQAANPSLTPAWDRHGGEAALEVIGKELGAGLERAAKRMKKG
jgi:hypothetical protein